MKRIAVLGAGGYAGREVAALVREHPELELAHAMSARPGVAPAAPQLPVDMHLEALDPERLGDVDGVFLCTPHGAAAELAQVALAAGCRVVDLSADFRLKDARVYREAYGADHPAPELLAEAVYGLTEFARDAVREARLVANPGCYPTSILLPLTPLLAAGLVAGAGAIVADSKSGVSGAGKTPATRTHFGSTHENFLAYAIGTHRHTPEIHQQAGTDRIVFVPHLLPVFRGILTTLYLPPAEGVTAGEVRAVLAERFADEPFVQVYDRGLPELDRVQHTNQCHLAVAEANGLVVVVSALDNLVKGAAGQAVQNMNLCLGLAETAGLR